MTDRLRPLTIERVRFSPAMRDVLATIPGASEMNYEQQLAALRQRVANAIRENPTFEGAADDLGVTRHTLLSWRQILRIVLTGPQAEGRETAAVA